MGATVELMTMTTRRYGDDEVREIFRLATEGERRDPSLPVDPGGLRLSELQRIGQEAGIEPERVAAAGRGARRPRKALAGAARLWLPIGIARMVDLPRAPTEREWEQLVAQCRTTFAVQGQATIEGGLRTWSHGNLHLSIEPTADGERLRLHSRSEAAELLNGIGTGVGGLSLLMSGVVAAAGKPEKALAVLGMFGGIALAAFPHQRRARATVGPGARPPNDGTGRARGASALASRGPRPLDAREAVRMDGGADMAFRDDDRFRGAHWPLRVEGPCSRTRAVGPHHEFPARQYTCTVLRAKERVG
jgi:hypothetical protein